MSSSQRVVITFTFVPVVAAAVILGLTYSTYISSGRAFAAVALPTLATSHGLLRSAGLQTGSAAGGALAVTALSYVVVIAVAIEFLVN